MLSDYFDVYSLNARVRPSLLALLPPTLTVYVIFPKLYELAVALVSLLLLFGLITALVHFVRYKGRMAEKKLIALWGAKPTTYLLRQDDNGIDSVTKQRYYDFFELNIKGWSLPEKDNKNSTSVESDVYYESAIKWLLERTRDPKKYSLLLKENISYGFRRNSFGIKRYALFLSFASIIFLVTNISFPELLNLKINLVFTLATIFISSILTFWWLLLVNSNWVKDSAESYAIRLLSSCEDISVTK